MRAHIKADKQLKISLSADEMNETLGTDGVVPSALFFGEYPQFSTDFNILPATQI